MVGMLACQTSACSIYWTSVPLLTMLSQDEGGVQLNVDLSLTHSVSLLCLSDTSFFVQLLSESAGKHTGVMVLDLRDTLALLISHQQQPIVYCVTLKCICLLLVPKSAMPQMLLLSEGSIAVPVMPALPALRVQYHVTVSAGDSVMHCSVSKLRLAGLHLSSSGGCVV